MADNTPMIAKHEGPSRRSPEPYWKRATPDPRILRRWFSRRALLDTLRELVWLAPLSAIIWIYAEREQITQPTKIETSVNIISSDRGRFVQPSDNVPIRVVLTLQGPQVSVNEVRDKLTTNVPRGLQLDIVDELPPGQHELLDISSRIKALREFETAGVSVLDVQPAQVSITVDTIEQREVDVQVPPRVGDLTSSATFEPRKVHLRGPANVLSQLVDQGNLKVYADITGSDVLRTPGKKDLPSVPLTLSQPETGLTIEPPSVHATLDVRAADVPGVIASVPIVIEAPPAMLRINEINLTIPTLANLHVIGPPDQVSGLVNQNLQARAVLDVDTSGQGKVKYELPDGVRPAPGETDRTVGFTVTRRDNGG